MKAAKQKMFWFKLFAVSLLFCAPRIALGLDVLAPQTRAELSAEFGQTDSEEITFGPAIYAEEYDQFPELASESSVAPIRGGVGESFGRISADGFTPPRIFTNRHGQLTNGVHTLDDAGMAVHTTGSLAEGKSQFLFRVNDKQLVLDAAAYADEASLWIGNKAKIMLDRPIGVHGTTGELTNVLNIYRNENGFIHGAPGSPQ